MTAAQRPVYVSSVETYPLWLNGHYVRKATLVKFSDGQVIKFLDRIPKREAVKQAVAERERQKTVEKQYLVSVTVNELEIQLARAIMHNDQGAAAKARLALEEALNSTDFPKVSA